jgi:hypothetical protein
VSVSYSIPPTSDLETLQNVFEELMEVVAHHELRHCFDEGNDADDEAARYTARLGYYDIGSQGSGGSLSPPTLKCHNTGKRVKLPWANKMNVHVYVISVCISNVVV